MVDMTTAAVDKTFEHEQRTIEIMLSNVPEHISFVDFINKRESTGAVDGFVGIGGLLAYAVEQKSRNISAAQLDEWGEELLINANKLSNLQQFARLANLPVHMWTYLIPNDVVVDTLLVNADGEFVAPIRIEHGEYQQSANGGRVTRNVAYIDASGSHHYRFQPRNQTDTSQPFAQLQRFHEVTEQT